MTDEEADQAVEMFSQLRRAHDEHKKKERRLRCVSIATGEQDSFKGLEVFRLGSDDGDDSEDDETFGAQNNNLEEDEDMALLLKYSRPISELYNTSDMQVMGLFSWVDEVGD